MPITPVPPLAPASPREGSSPRLAKRLAFVAGLAAILTAGFAWPVLGKFGSMFRELGDPADLSPAASFILAHGGVWPAGLLGITGALSLLASFSRRGGCMLAAGFASLGLTATAGAVIPVVLMNAIGGLVGSSPAASPAKPAPLPPGAE